MRRENERRVRREGRGEKGEEKGEETENGEGKTRRRREGWGILHVGRG